MSPLERLSTLTASMKVTRIQQLNSREVKQYLANAFVARVLPIVEDDAVWICCMCRSETCPNCYSHLDNYPFLTTIGNDLEAVVALCVERAEKFFLQLEHDLAQSRPGAYGG